MNPFGYDGKGSWSPLDYYIEKGYTILPATDFLEEKFVYGQEYEFSYEDDFMSFETRVFLCMSPVGERFIAWDKKSGLIEIFNYCRKINTERNEAITKAKELIRTFDVKQEEVY